MVHGSTAYIAPLTMNSGGAAEAYFTSDDRGEDKLTEAEVLRSWLRDTQGPDCYSGKILNRRTGQMEERQFVWVATSVTRSKAEETRATRSSTLSTESKEFTTSQIQEANLRVASLVPWFVWSCNFMQSCSYKIVMQEGQDGMVLCDCVTVLMHCRLLCSSCTSAALLDFWLMDSWGDWSA